MTVATRDLEGSAARAHPTLQNPTMPWVGRHLVLVVATDVSAALIAVLLAQVVRFGFEEEQLRSDLGTVPYPVLSLVLVAAWLAVLALCGTYSAALVGAGPDEYQRVLNGAARFVAGVAVVAFVADLPLARGFVAPLVPLALVLTLLGRWRVRRWLHRRRARGECCHHVVVAGPVPAVTEVVRHLRRAAHAGYRVVGVCVDDRLAWAATPDGDVPVIGSPGSAATVVRQHGADVLAVAGEPWASGAAVREATLVLEGSATELVVAPALTRVAGPRIGVRAVAGLPLLHVEQPRLSGVARAMKGVVDRVLAVVLLLVLAPVLLLIAALVKASGGPVLFRQRRVGRDGEVFTMWKFRTMVPDAESQLATVIDLNESDGPLFKVRADPRVTSVGRVLRRCSLDELPQLVHVLTGRMSLVGPRPPLPSEVARYGVDAWRRLLVKPGMTGLWQISGRADLSWDESLRLDVHYVENWSPMLDATIAWKTLAAVIHGRGAY